MGELRFDGHVLNAARPFDRQLNGVVIGFDKSGELFGSVADLSIDMKKAVVDLETGHLTGRAREDARDDQQTGFGIVLPDEQAEREIGAFEYDTRLILFADGFESADTSAWSAVGR